MSAKPPPPQDDIEELPLDLFGAETADATGTPPNAIPPTTIPPDTPPDTAAASNVRTWVEAGLKPGVDESTGLPRRLRRAYDLFAIVCLWILAGLIYGGISLHGRMFWLLFLAVGVYVFLTRFGRTHKRFHLFLDNLRRRIGT